MPGWKFVIGGGEKIKNQEPQNNQYAPREESGNGRSGNNTGNSGRQNHDGGSMTNAVAYQPHQDNGNRSGNGGSRMMAYSNMAAGDYPSQNNGGRNGDYAMYMPDNGPQNREVGFLAPLPDWENPSGRDGRGMRSEEYYPDSGDVEARRRRSRRTGRFIRGEGEDGPEMRHRDYDDDEDEGREHRGSYSRRGREEESGETSICAKN